MHLHFLPQMVQLRRTGNTRFLPPLYGQSMRLLRTVSSQTPIPPQLSTDRRGTPAQGLRNLLLATTLLEKHAILVSFYFGQLSIVSHVQSPLLGKTYQFTNWPIPQGNYTYYVNLAVIIFFKIND